jgi:PEP-CTERM motif
VNSSVALSTSYLTTTGMVNFTGTDTVDLVDTTNGGLSLRMNQPYLLISAGSDSMFSGLVTVGANGVLALDGNGTVLGVWQGGDLTNYTAITINEFGADGASALSSTSTSSEGYYEPSLILENGDLEVVPEPGTWTLMLGGLALLVVIQRRKNKLS